jgi:hypothetical protein
MPFVLAEKGIRRPATTQLLPVGERNPARRVANPHRLIAAAGAKCAHFDRQVGLRKLPQKLFGPELVEFPIQFVAPLELGKHLRGQLIKSGPFGVDFGRDIGTHGQSQRLSRRL